MNPDPDLVCSQRSDPDPVQIGPDPQHWCAVQNFPLGVYPNTHQDIRLDLSTWIPIRIRSGPETQNVASLLPMLNFEFIVPVPLGSSSSNVPDSQRKIYSEALLSLCKRRIYKLYWQRVADTVGTYYLA
jgi:hypothetical protein